MLTDFGLSKKCISENSFQSFSGGTPEYQAPEQASNNKCQANKKSDIYSLGKTFLRILKSREEYEKSENFIISIDKYQNLISWLIDDENQLRPNISEVETMLKEMKF